MITEFDEQVLDDAEHIARTDPHGLLRAVATAGPQVREATALAAEAGVQHLADEGRPRALVVAGVGPAGRTGDVLGAVVSTRCPVPILSHRSAGVPGWVGAGDVVIAVSASGKGPEALAAAEAAAARGARLVAIGAPGSPLQSCAEGVRAPFVPVPSRPPARSNIWALLVPVLLSARALKLIDIPEADLAETASRLDADAESCRPGCDSFVNPAKSLAFEIAGSLPVVWGTSRLATVAANRFVDQLAANARYPAIAGSLIEAGRGRVGIMDGFFGTGSRQEMDFFADRLEQNHHTNIHIVLFRDHANNPREERRADAVAELARQRGLAVSEINAVGESALERFASLVATPDFASVYLALLHGIDPAAIPAVSDLKERMSP